MLSYISGIFRMQEIRHYAQYHAVDTAIGSLHLQKNLHKHMHTYTCYRMMHLNVVYRAFIDTITMALWRH